MINPLADPNGETSTTAAHEATIAPMPALVDDAAADGSATVTAPVDELITKQTDPPALDNAPVLVKKHRLASRWMHWINFPLLGIMIWSGLLIYWADSDAANLHPHAPYRIGLGSWTLFRFFPDGFYARLGMPFRLAEGMGWHFFFMWLFMLNGVAYVLYTAISGAWRELVPDRHSFKNAIQITLYDLHLRKVPPPVSKYNGAQQIAYTAIVLAGGGSLLTGLAIYKPTQLHILTWLLGGYECARFLHFWLTMGYVIFFVIHVLQVARAGWNNFRSMVTGYELQSPATESSRHV
jgi:thiosulfate reductase cytochrome b subunit